MLDVFILYSGESNYLDLQISLCRRYIKDVENFFLVQGPFIPNVVRAQGIEDFSGFEGIRTILVPNHKNFITTKIRRMERVASYVLQHVCMHKPTRKSLIIHSDTLPVNPLDISEILRGRPLASRVGTNSHPVYPSITWLAVDNRYLSMNRGVFDYNDPTIYGAQNISEKFGFYFPNSPQKPYIKMNMLYCEPGFVHLSDISTDREDVRQHKQTLIEDNFEWLMQDKSM